MSGVGFSALLAIQANASPLVYQYDSIIDASLIGLSSSENVTFVYGFDTLTLDTNPSPNLGRYALTSLNITLGSFSTTLTNPGDPQAVIFIAENNAVDAYFVSAFPATASFSGLINGFQLTGANFTLTDTTTATWGSDSLVTSTSLLNALPYGSARLVFSGGLSIFRPGEFIDPVTGLQSVTTTPFSISVVPEPSALLFVGMGLTMLSARRSRVGGDPSK